MFQTHMGTSSLEQKMAGGGWGVEVVSLYILAPPHCSGQVTAHLITSVQRKSNAGTVPLDVHTTYGRAGIWPVGSS